METSPAPSPSGKRGRTPSTPAISAACLVNADHSLPSSPGPGGTHCLGASVEHAVCENLPCPKGLPSFRDQQCQMHDRLSSKKKGLLTAVVVDGKGIWRILSERPPSPAPQDHKHLLGKPTGHPHPHNPPKRTLQSCPAQPWTHRELNLDDPALRFPKSSCEAGSGPATSCPPPTPVLFIARRVRWQPAI